MELSLHLALYNRLQSCFHSLFVRLLLIVALISKLHFVPILKHFIPTGDQVAVETRLCLQIST